MILRNVVLHRLAHLAVDRSQDPVHEARTGIAPETLGKLDRLIDGDLRRDLVVVPEHELVDPEAQYVPVDDRYLLERPLRRAFLDKLVDGLPLTERPLHQVLGEHGILQARGEFLDVALQNLARTLIVLPLEVPLKE